MLANQGAFRPWGFPLASWAFAIRIWIAAVVALYCSFWLELESPSVALLTVAFLAEPSRGQALEKAAFRLIATIIGITASIVITGIFSQTRDLLLIAFSVWLGLCVCVSGLLDGSRAYAAALSGYTVAFLAVQQIDNPAHVFESSMARGAAIVIGIISVAIVNDVLSAPDRHPRLAIQLAEIHRRIRNCARATILGETIDSPTYMALIAEIAFLRPEIASLSSESSSGPARGVAAQNAAIALVAETHAVRGLGMLPPLPDKANRDRIARALEQRSWAAATGDFVLQAGAHGDVPSSWTLKELMRRDEQVQLNLDALEADVRPPWQWRPLLYRPYRNAAESGIRATIWFGLAAIFFVFGGWPAASVSLSFVGAVIGLGALTPNPLATTTFALVVAPVAGILAGILEFLILDGVADFPLLAIGLAPLIVATALLMTSPNRLVSVLGRLSLIATVFIFAPSNPQSYDAQSYVFLLLFYCVAMGVLLFAQLLLPPVSNDQRRRRLMASARRELDQVFLDRGNEPEEEMFRDAIRISQFVSASGGVSDDAEAADEMLSYFDRSSAIRLCIDKLKLIPDVALADEARAALTSRDPLALRKATGLLGNISSQNPTIDELGAALLVASRFIDRGLRRSDRLREVA